MNKLTKKTIDRIFALRKQGKSRRVIAREVGCSPSAVWYHLNKDAATA